MLEFLSTLQTSHDEVYFRMFNQEYKITWNQFSRALDFAANCSLDLELAT